MPQVPATVTLRGPASEPCLYLRLLRQRLRRLRGGQRPGHLRHDLHLEPVQGLQRPVPGDPRRGRHSNSPTPGPRSCRPRPRPRPAPRPRPPARRCRRATPTATSTITNTLTPTPAPLLLNPHHPNPDPAGPGGVWLPFSISVAAKITVKVYDISGELIVAGYGAVFQDGRKPGMALGPA